jgi:hypothetical protein
VAQDVRRDPLENQPLCLTLDLASRPSETALVQRAWLDRADRGHEQHDQESAFDRRPDRRPRRCPPAWGAVSTAEEDDTI